MPSLLKDSGDWRTLDALISPDPNLPSVAYQAHENVPIVFPWTRQSIPLGTGLASNVASKAVAGENAFRPSAFALMKDKHISQLELSDNSNTFRQNSSTHTSNSYEHMDLKGSLSVGGSFLGASGRAEFNKNVYDNRDSSKVSLQASARVGRITRAGPLHLSRHAIALLRSSPAAFHDTYGDYFLYALCIGADTSTLLSAKSSIDLKSEMRDIQVKAKIFWATKTVYEDHTRSQSSFSTYDITYSGFDTLSGYARTGYAADQLTYKALKLDATRNIAGGIGLDKRLEDVLQSFKFEVKPGETTLLTGEQCAQICASGLVVEAMFLPYSGLRDYVAATSVRAAPQLEREL